MTDRNRIDVADGKYTVVGIEDGHLRALRHGEEWRSLTGDNLIFALAVELQEARERLRGDAGWEYYATAREGYVAGEPRVHVRGAIQAYEEELDQAVFEQEDDTPVVFKRRAAGPWEPVEGDTLARHARDSGA